MRTTPVLAAADERWSRLRELWAQGLLSGYCWSAIHARCSGMPKRKSARWTACKCPCHEVAA